MPGLTNRQPLALGDAIATAPIRQLLHILPGVAIQTFVHGPNRIYADVSLLDGRMQYAIATMSSLIPTATVDHPVGTGDFTIAAGATLTFRPAARSAPGAATIDCCFVTPTARTPYEGQIATWEYA